MSLVQTIGGATSTAPTVHQQVKHSQLLSELVAALTAQTEVMSSQQMDSDLSLTNVRNEIKATNELLGRLLGQLEVVTLYTDTANTKLGEIHRTQLFPQTYEHKLDAQTALLIEVLAELKKLNEPKVEVKKGFIAKLFK